MSTPKEELIESASGHIADILNEPGVDQGNVKDLLEYALKRVATGMWVSVDERLPDRETTGEWRGYAMFKNGEVDIVTWYHYQTSKDITHWLDLELPEVGG